MARTYAKISTVDSEASNNEDCVIFCPSPSSALTIFSSLEEPGAFSSGEEDASSIGNLNYDILNDELLLAVAANQLDKVKRLLEKDVTPNATREGSYLSAVHLASLEGLDPILDTLLSSGASAERIDREGRSPLHLAVWAGHVTCVDLLLRKCPGLLSLRAGDNRWKTVHRKWLDIYNLQNQLEDKLPRPSPGSTALHVASQWARPSCASLLLKAGADVTLTDETGATPLDVLGEAIFLQDELEEPITADRFLEVLHLLMAAGATPTAHLQGRTSPVHAAVALECARSLQVLLSTEAYTSAGVHLGTQSSDSPLDLAIRRKWKEGVNLLLDKVDDVTTNSNSRNVFHVASEVGNEEIMKELLKRPSAKHLVNSCDGSKSPPLFYAIYGGHYNCVTLLLRACADVTKKDSFHRTVLHCACQTNQPRIINLLFQKRRTLMTKIIDCVTKGDGFQGTALHFAAHFGYAECVEILLRQGCVLSTLSQYNQRPYSALQLAAESGHCNVIETLLKHDDTLLLNEQLYSKFTSLHLACLSGHAECAALLVKHGSELTAQYKDKDGNMTSALDLYISHINTPVAEMEKILDSCITYSTQLSGNRCIVIDYNVLLKTSSAFVSDKLSTSQNNQLSVIDALLRTGNRIGQRDLLSHPLIDTFLHLQWKKLSSFYYVMMTIYTVFVLSSTFVALLVFTDILSSTRWYKTFVFIAHSCHIMTLLTWPVLLHFEAVQFCVIGGWYFKHKETWIKLVCYTLYPCSITPVVVYHIKGIQKEMQDWTYQLAAMAVLLGWLELMILLSRIPRYGFYVQMFIRVAKTFVKVLMSFACLIVGFMLAFFIAFKGKSHFDTVLNSLMKTVVMMTGEFEYSDLFQEYVSEEESETSFLDHQNEIIYNSYTKTHIAFLKVLFLFFVLFVGIVLTNVIVAVAVNDVKDLLNMGKIDRLQKRARFLSTLEKIYSFKLCCVFCLPNRLIRPIPPTLQINIDDNSSSRKPLSERLIRALIAKAEANKTCT